MALKEEYADGVVFIVVDLQDPAGAELATYFNVPYIPLFYFLDSEGNLASGDAGLLSAAELAGHIEPLLGLSAPDEEAQTGLQRFMGETLPEAVGGRSPLALALVFLGGVLTSVSPCVLSMVPLLVGYIGAYGQESRLGGFALAASFVVGLALTFALLGFAASHFGRVFGQVDERLYFILVVVCLVMGLQLVGVLNLNLPGLQRLPGRLPGPGGALLVGLLFGLIASPCATPVLAVILTYAAVQAAPFYGGALLFTYGLGHGLPLLVAGTFSGLARSMPRLSRYTGYFSHAAGALLIFTGLALFYWVLRQ